MVVGNSPKLVVIIVAAISTVAIVAVVAIVVLIAADKAAMVTKATLMRLLLPIAPKVVDSVKTKPHCIAIADATIVKLAAIIAMD